MRIESLTIENFRGIQRVHLSALPDLVIIAGQNGSGKSCILDAIRLLKSAYGGYQRDEFNQWFGEFSINLQSNKNDLLRVLNDKTRPANIGAVIRLSDAERAYLASNVDRLLGDLFWEIEAPGYQDGGQILRSRLSAQARELEPKILERVAQERDGVLAEIGNPLVSAHVSVRPDGQVVYQRTRLLELVFSTVDPGNIGIVDFHGANRQYTREMVGSVSLEIAPQDARYKSNSLYNYNQKYAAVKSEMAASYVREVVAERAGHIKASQSRLTRTLQELFERFFPGKAFLGPQPRSDGGIDFPVSITGSGVHDLDELSSGEKEILYGYLRMRQSAPKHSIIMIDEPELHLNPRLVSELPGFYRVHLCEELDNQMWMVSHSDALIRQGVSMENTKVFHMTPAGSSNSDNQLRELRLDQEVVVAVADLIGDIASLQPYGKCLILEGGGETEFDKVMCSRLFGEELRGINIISGSNKSGVRNLHSALARTSAQVPLPFRFFSITDRDTDSEFESTPGDVSSRSWDVYHIENYLLSTKHITLALNTISLQGDWTEGDVDRMLLEAAEEVAPDVVTHLLRRLIQKITRPITRLTYDPSAPRAERIFERIKNMEAALSRALSSSLSIHTLEEHEREIGRKVQSSLRDGRWRTDFPGREVLKKFTRICGCDAKYEVLRNTIINKMVDTAYQPASMREIINEVVRS